MPHPQPWAPAGHRQVGLAGALWAPVTQEPSQDVWVPPAQPGGPLRADAGPSVSSYLLHHRLGGHCPLLTASCGFAGVPVHGHSQPHHLTLPHSILGAAEGRAGPGGHCHHPQLFAGQGEGYKDVAWTVRGRGTPRAWELLAAAPGGMAWAEPSAMGRSGEGEQGGESPTSQRVRGSMC